MPFYYGEMTNFSCPLPVYPELAALVGATVPDYRGYFLRGVGGNSASLGEKQGDAIKHPTTESVLHFWKSFENCWATGVFFHTKSIRIRCYN